MLIRSSQNYTCTANFQKGFIVPVGTPISNLEKHRGYATFVDVKTGLNHKINFERDHHPNKTSEEIFDRIFTTKTYEELTQGLSKTDIALIQNGEVKKGMSKAAVLISLGYPPESRTPTTHVKMWRFWKHRNHSYVVHFQGENVSKIVE